MREKLEQLRDKISELKEKEGNCNHVWSEPTYSPDLFDGIDRWVYTCSRCGKKVVSFDPPTLNDSKKR